MMDEWTVKIYRESFEDAKEQRPDSISVRQHAMFLGHLVRGSWLYPHMHITATPHPVFASQTMGVRSPLTVSMTLQRH